MSRTSLPSGGYGTWRFKSAESVSISVLAMAAAVADVPRRGCSTFTDLLHPPKTWSKRMNLSL